VQFKDTNIIPQAYQRIPETVKYTHKTRCLTVFID